jgi:hypothetical protein
VTTVRGLTREDRRMLLEERRDLCAMLRRPRPFYMGAVEWAQDRAATRARIAEIDEELLS